MQRITMMAMLLGMAAVLTLGCGGNQAGLPGAGWQSYHNSHMGLSIAYPPNWDAIDITDAEVNFVPALGQSSQGNVILSTDNLSAHPMTLNQYYDQNMAQIRQFYKDFQSVESSATTLGNVSADEVVYTSSLGQTKFEFMQVFCIRDNKAYIFTYTNNISQYANSVGQINQMVDTLTFD